jgi:hypothetical protein
MNQSKRIAEIPLKEIWDESGLISQSKIRELSYEDIVALLQLGKVHFVVANVGDTFQWIPLEQCYKFWKSEVKNHIVEPAKAEDGFLLEEYPGSYCYIASEWCTDMAEPVIVLSVYH